MRPEQDFLLREADRHGTKRPKEPTKDESRIYHTWYAKQTDLRQDDEGRRTNLSLFWAMFYMHSAEITESNLNTFKQSSALAPLLEKVQQPTLKVPTKDEVEAAEAEFAKLEPKWRGVYEYISTEAGVRREIVSYSSPENLQKLVDAICDPAYPAYAYGAASGETFLIAFKTLVANKHMTEIRRPDRPTHNKPATLESIRKAHEQTDHSKEQKHDDFLKQEAMEHDFYDDLRKVMNFTAHSSFGEGKIAWGATYEARKSGMQSLHEKWDGKFNGTKFAAEYERRVFEADDSVRHISPSGGSISNRGHDPTGGVIHGGGSI